MFGIETNWFLVCYEYACLSGKSVTRINFLKSPTQPNMMQD